MSAYDDILSALPLHQLAGELGASPDEVAAASQAVLPALFGGLEANAQGGGSMSILEALGQHDTDLLSGGIDLSQIDQQDGAAIASHIFGDQQDQVINQLGAMQLGGGSLGGSLVRKLIPILAPIVLSYIANKVLGRMGGGASGGSGSSGGSGGGLGDILGQILGGGGMSAPAPRADTSPSLPTGSGSSGEGGPGSLDDLLKDVLGGAAGSSAPQQRTQQDQQTQQMPDAGSIITDILGGMLGGGRR